LGPRTGVDEMAKRKKITAPAGTRTPVVLSSFRMLRGYKGKVVPVLN